MAGAKMETEYLDYGELIGAAVQYSVPVYQRKYSWSDEQYERLWKAIDILRSSSGRPPHFMGAVVVAPKTKSRYTIHVLVDGQQRILTLCVLTLAIADSMATLSRTKKIRQSLYLPVGKKSEPRVVAGPLDDETLVALLENSPTIELKQQLMRCYEFYIRKLERFSDSELVRILGIVKRRLRFVRIITDRNANPQEIFETLNHDGMPLDPVDLIRNYLFMGVGAKADDLYRTRWVSVEASLRGRSLSDFFLCWSIYESRIGLHNLRIDQKSLFPAFKELTTARFIGLTGGESLIRQLAEEAQPFVEIIRPSSMTFGANKLQRQIQVLLEDLRTWNPHATEPMIYQLHYQWRESRISDSEYVKSLHEIESFLVRWMLAGNPQGNMTSYLRSIARSEAFQVESRNPATILRGFFNRSQPKGELPTNELIFKRLAGANFYKSDSQHHYVLRRLFQADQQLRNGELIMPAFDPRALKQPPIDRRWSIDHIMPQNRTQWKPELTAWGVKEEMAERVLHTIGNLCLLPESTNPAAGNLPWSSVNRSNLIEASQAPEYISKRDWYKSIGFNMTNGISKNRKFTPEIIRKRSRTLAQLAFVVWPEPWK